MPSIVSPTPRPVLGGDRCMAPWSPQHSAPLPGRPGWLVFRSMDISLSGIAVVCLTVFAGSVVQGTVGFASGMFVTPILVATGWALPTAIGVNLVSNVVQSLWGAYRLRHAIDWANWLRPYAVRLAWLPVGAGVLLAAEVFQPAVIRQLVGSVILLVTGAFWLWRVRPRETLHVGWEYLAMSLSGFLAGLCGIGGPPMVLWIVSQTWPADRARVFLFLAFSLSLVPQTIILVLLFDEQATLGLVLGCCALPAAVAGTMLGLRVGSRLPPEPLRRLMFLVLVIVAVGVIVMPWLLSRE